MEFCKREICEAEVSVQGPPETCSQEPNSGWVALARLLMPRFLVVEALTKEALFMPEIHPDGHAAAPTTEAQPGKAVWGLIWCKSNFKVERQNEVYAEFGFLVFLIWINFVKV